MIIDCFLYNMMHVEYSDYKGKKRHKRWDLVYLY